MDYTAADLAGLPAWEVDLLTGPTPVEAPRPHMVKEWAILDSSDMGRKSNIIYRWPADKGGRRNVEREYDGKGYGFDPTKCFALVNYWSDDPADWWVEGPTFF